MFSAPLTELVANPSAAQFGLLLVYVAVLWLPGMAVGALVGIRGWALAALGPLLTYGLATCSAPWMSRLGIPWTSTTVGLLLLGVLAVVGILRWLLRRWAGATSPSPEVTPLPAWTTGAHAVVGLAVLAAAAFGGNVLLVAFGGMGGISQEWDVMLHANGIRYIAETGAGGVYQMYEINTYAGDQQVYYPNAYHLLGALVFELTGMGIPEVLNAQNVLMPLMLALALVALIRSFHGRAALATFAALVSATATAVVYDLMPRGPLLPFATGVVLSFGILVALRIYLDRPSMLTAIPLILAGAGLLGLHPSMLFTAVVFALPLLAQRWWRRSRRVGVEAAVLVAPAVIGGLLVFPHLAGALSAAEGVIGFTWKQVMTPAHAFGEIISFSTGKSYPQLWLLAFFIIGVFGFRSLGQLRWLPVAGGIFAILFVLAAAYDTPWAHMVTSLWWNDRYRLAAIATMAFLPIVAHGMVRTYDVVLNRVMLLPMRWISPKSASFRRPIWAVSASALLVFAMFFVLANGGYAQRNVERVDDSYGPGQVVNAAELQAFQVLDRLVEPGERVMNDRFDGSGWMYALTGVHPVAAHFGPGGIGEGPELLARKFDSYDTSPAVRAAVERLNVEWVMVSPGFVRNWKEREPGLDELEQVDALELVYEEAGVRIYKLGRPADIDRHQPPLVAPSGSN